MKNTKNKIIIFDIVNYQEQYALCLEVIKRLEYKQSFEREFLQKIVNKIKITICELDRIGSLRYIEQPIVLKGKDNAGNDQFTSQQSVTNKRVAGIKEIEYLRQYQGNLVYQIRIHMQHREGDEIDKSEFIHLQYLALLLKNLDELSFFNKHIQKKIMIFVVPTTGDMYPYRDKNGKIDCDTYHLLSQYLRLLSANFTGVIFGAMEEKDITVTALNFRKDRKYETYFSVVLIDEKTYQKLFDTIDTNVLPDTYRELFALLPSRRFRDSRNEHPDIALCDFLLETSIKRIKARLKDIYSDQDIIKDRLELIKDVILSDEEQNIMQFCLFSFMLCIEKRKTEEESLHHIKNTWQLAWVNNPG